LEGADAAVWGQLSNMAENYPQLGLFTSNLAKVLNILAFVAVV
jgi:hypothetical protein